MGETSGGVRRERKDKARNREHILEVADEYFSAADVSGSLDAIAKRAGVGAGTLYRHFPTREALLAALLQARNEVLADRRDEIWAEGHDPGVALGLWLEAIDEWLSAFRGLPEPLRTALSDEASPLAITCQGFVTDTDEFLVPAQRQGQAQPGVRGRDLFLGALATSWARGAVMADDASAESLKELLRRGWAAPTPPA
ncbi:TetR/AcrR family transcriptional regulator [Patulibacter minatonensis]|uniref:TetR/AcrR family transcriptional regulator n=1 Tax=Patulibacter minatonensis TaxID=298163 RepID=UPI000479F4E4|nr:TetR/AcrR family transcriptional regulator [Patulibacter minatonensis]